MAFRGEIKEKVEKGFLVMGFVIRDVMTNCEYHLSSDLLE